MTLRELKAYLDTIPPTKENLDAEIKISAQWSYRQPPLSHVRLTSKTTDGDTKEREGKFLLFYAESI